MHKCVDMTAIYAFFDTARERQGDETGGVLERFAPPYGSMAAQTGGGVVRD